jgi:hypothetical protein
MRNPSLGDSAPKCSSLDIDFRIELILSFLEGGFVPRSKGDRVTTKRPKTQTSELREDNETKERYICDGVNVSTLVSNIYIALVLRVEVILQDPLVPCHAKVFKSNETLKKP